MALAFLLLDFYTKLSLRKIELIQNKVELTWAATYSLECSHGVVISIAVLHLCSGSEGEQWNLWWGVTDLVACH